jgi:hypothetical protein
MTPARALARVLLCRLGMSRTTQQTSDPAGRDLGELLKTDHERLETLFEGLLNAFEADARDDLRTLWSELDASLTAHMALEERVILPAFAKLAPDEAAALIGEHRQLRERLLELGVCVDLNAIRGELGRTFITELRDHARREAGLLYRWAAIHGDREQAAEPPDQLRAPAP